MKNSLKTIFLFSISVCIALVLSEITIRTFAPQRVSSGRSRVEPDEYLLYKLTKNQSVLYTLGEFEVTEATNSLGLRDHEITTKRPGSFRFLGLGDSFCFASGIELEDIFFKRLERSLPDSWKKPVEIVNCAVWGYSLLQEVRFLKRDGLALQPDAVIIGYYVGNDFLDSYDLFDAEGNPTIIAKDGDLVSRVSADDPNKVRYFTARARAFLATHSHLYCFLRERMSAVLVRFGLVTPPPPPDFCAKEFDEHLQKGWEMNQRLLQDASTFARTNGVRLIVVILPAIYQVYEDMWRQEISHLKVDGSLYDLEKPQRILSEFCVQNKIECVDLLPALRSRQDQQDLFYRIDAHPTSKGHRIIADSLSMYFSAHPYQVYGDK